MYLYKHNEGPPEIIQKSQKYRVNNVGRPLI